MVEHSLEIWAYFLQLRGVKISALIQVELSCVSAQEKVQSQSLVIFVGRGVENDILDILLVFLDDGVVDLPAVGLDYVCKEYALQLINEQTPAHCP